MGKHEARASLLDGASTIDRSSSPSPYPPAYRSRGQSYADSYMGDQYANVEPEYTTAGGYHQREGYAVGSKGANKKNSWAYWPDSRWQWLYVATILVQAALGLALEWCARQDRDDRTTQLTQISLVGSLPLSKVTYEVFQVNH